MRLRFKEFFRSRLVLVTCIVAILSISSYVVYLRYKHNHLPLNLVLISIDTLRADRLGSYGYQRDTSPALDKLAQISTVFERVVSPSSWTLPAHVSMMSGLYPSTHNIQKSRGQKIADSTVLLSKLLQENGYSTVGVTGGGFLSHVYGFNKGFDRFIEAEKYAPGKERTSIHYAVKTARKELKKISEEKPFFLFLHTYDVHCPYSPPKAYSMMYQSDDADEIEADHCGNTYYNVNKTTKENALYLSDRYDESIRAVDDSLGKFFDYLKSRNDYERTVIVVTSDHGEEFFEHGKIGHDSSLYSELLFVPMIMHVPNAEAQRISEHVSLVDIFPTVMDVLNLWYPPNVDGASLAKMVKGEVAPYKVRPFEFSELKRGLNAFSRIGDRSQLIVTENNEESYFFDLVKDPTEQNNLVLRKPDWFSAKHNELLSFISSRSRIGLNITPDVQTEREDQIKRLQSLGYL